MRPGPLELEYEVDAAPFPGRHPVLPAFLIRDGERIPVVVKRVRADWRQRLKRKTKGERSLEVAEGLQSRGIDTPEPLGLEVREGESVFVTSRLTDCAQIRQWFLHRDDPERHPLPPLAISLEEVIRALGRLARRMHDGGVFYRDFSDGNILVTTSEAGARLWLVDLDRARLSQRPVGLLGRLRDLSRPGINRPEDRRLFLAAYQGKPRPDAVFLLLVSAFRKRLVLWDSLKRRTRPWRRRELTGAGLCHGML